MPRALLKKERWTITFDRKLKSRVQQEARKLRVYPVQILESLVRERLNPYGFQTVLNSVAYVNSARTENHSKNDKDFLSEIQKWQKR